MIYAFALPLVMGVIPYTMLLIREKQPSIHFLRLWSAAIAVLSTGCVFLGVLEIYGTTNQLVMAYPITGSLLLTAALASILFRPRDKESRKLCSNASGNCTGHCSLSGKTMRISQERRLNF